MKAAVGGVVVELLSLAVGEPVASPQHSVATDVKITLSWKGMTGWMWRKEKKKQPIRDSQTLLNMLFQEVNVISIWTKRKAATSPKPERRAECSNIKEGNYWIIN